MKISIKNIVEDANKLLASSTEKKMGHRSVAVVEQFNHLKNLLTQLEKSKLKKRIAKTDLDIANEMIKKINQKLEELRPLKTKNEKHLHIANEIYKQIESGELFEFNCSDEMKARLMNDIRNEILTTKTGLRLFEALLMLTHDPKITIEDGEENINKFVPDRNTIRLYNYEHKAYTLVLSQTGERFLQKISFTSTFFHECCHALHYLLLKEGYHDLSKESLQPNMDDMEEQLTISGLYGVDEVGNPEVMPINEKAFLIEKDQPFPVTTPSPKGEGF